MPLLGAVQFTGAIDSNGVSGDGLTLSASSLPASLDFPCYVHVVGGSAAGSFASVVSNSSGSVTLESAISGLAAGDSFRVVSHSTLSDVTSASQSSVPDSSTVTVYNADGSNVTYTTFGNQWFDSDFGSADNVILFPGEGVVINLQSETTLVFTGAVNTVPFQVTVSSGAVNLVGSVNPSTPSGSSSLGAALSSLPDSSTITIYSGDGSLTIVGTFTLFGGTWFDSDFQAQEISVAAPSVIVVNPQGTSSVSLPAAYTSN